MSQLDELVVGVVALYGGTLVGRIRLQKVIYLLDQLGMESGANFDYYHYGPYSEDISDAIADAKFLDKIKEKVEFRQVDGAPYSAFSTESLAPDSLGKLKATRVRELIEKFTDCTSTVLELAATIHWLAVREGLPNWRNDLESLKAGKTGNGRVDKAITLLEELGLQPLAS